MSTELTKESQSVLDAGYFHVTPLVLEWSRRHENSDLSYSGKVSNEDSLKFTNTNLGFRWQVSKPVSFGIRGFPLKPITAELHWSPRNDTAITSRVIVDSSLKQNEMISSNSILLSYRPNSAFSGRMEADLKKKTLLACGTIWRRISFANFGISLNISQEKSQTQAKAGATIRSQSKIAPINATASISWEKVSELGKLKGYQFDIHSRFSGSTDIACRVTHSLVENLTKGIFGCVWKITDSSFSRMKVDTSGTATFAVQKKLTPELEFCFGTQLGTDQKVGAKLIFLL